MYTAVWKNTDSCTQSYRMDFVEFFSPLYESVFASVPPILFMVSTAVQLRLVRLTDHGLESSSGRNCLPCFWTLFLRMELGLLLDVECWN